MLKHIGTTIAIINIITIMTEIVCFVFLSLKLIMVVIPFHKHIIFSLKERSILMVLRTILFIFIWLAVLQFKLMSASNKEAQASAAFWERERKANFTRKKPLPVNDYIKLPFDKLPFSETNDPQEQEIQEQLRSLSKEPILNVSHMTNTDIKLTYGSGNFHLISEYGQNFLLLQDILNQWGILLYERGDKENAKTVLEYNISLGCDISKSYLVLADIYKEEQDYISIQDLMETVQNLHTLMKDSILRQLSEKLPT